MQMIAHEERGVALVAVLLFLVLSLMLVSSMLAVTGNEIIFSGSHRDSVRALDLAQAGVQEAIRRMQQGRPFAAGFTSSLSPNVTITVLRRLIGASSSYDEIQVTATVNRATRRLSALVLQRSTLTPPNITFANSVTQQGNGTIASGDAYARTFLQYKMNPTPGFTYAGWRVSKVPPGAVSPCYTNAQCAASGYPNWYPGIRRTENQSTSTGADIAAQTTRCAAGGGGSLPPDVTSGILATDSTLTVQSGLPVYGFDTDGGSAVTANLPCGLPYKLVSQTFTDENGSTQTILFKTIVYGQWFNNYWRWDEGSLSYVKSNSLINQPQFGAVPPFPDVNSFIGNYDQVFSGGGVISTGTLGTPSAPQAILLTGGNWQLNGNATGAGTLVVNGSLTVNGTFTYQGTVVVNGQFVQGAGTATITGGLIAQSTLDLVGTFTVYGGGNVPSVPLGPSIVTSRLWWER